MAKKRDESWPLIRRTLVNYMAPYWRRLIVAVLLMIVAGAMSGVFAKLMQFIVDDVFVTGNQTRVVLIASAVVVAFVIRGLSSFLHVVIMNKIGLNVTARVQNHLIRHLLNSDIALFQSKSTGVLYSHVVRDTSAMSNSLTGSLTSVVKSAVTLIALVAVMFWQDWRLALCIFIVFPALGIVVSRLGRRLRSVARGTQAEAGFLAASLMQTFQGIRQVKGYRQEKAEARKLEERIRTMQRLAARAFRLGEISSPLGELLSGLAIMTVILYGGSRVAAGEATAGALFSFITAFILAYEPMKALAKLNGVIEQGLAGAERVYAILDTPPVIADAANAQRLANPHPSVELRDVTFAFADGSPALNGLNIRALAGQTIALVGQSGAGKSTVLNLVMRFYDVNDGQVLVGGLDVRTLTLESLRDHISLVTQEVAVFDDTVHANIAYARPNANRQEVETAARAANAHDFIHELDDGYETRLGEQGTRLSGGQRQRIAIARAILSDAPVLLLDEATSALDTESERAVQDALNTLRSGRTTIIVAHRLSTIRSADRIYVLDQGKVIEEGSYAELVAHGGLFAQMDMLQQGEKLGISVEDEGQD
ncbi:ABC transporter ATP-binding protein [Radicibacter daui]|uniref:ABC transporter ATP-binding protein n=1 Tax=Radicibacter daui TaxID=3064829 RepID=UPI004046918E